ncbi:HORMA domain-containing protein [Sarocladium implicatum]|nr:HORMA domain-containing protein [Sarocladium implicatum]
MDPSTVPVPSSQASRLLTSFTTFLTLAIHSLLHHRALYPRATFLLTRAYNLPVPQSRHPAVCAWVNDAITAIAARIRKGEVQRVVFVVYAKAKVVERWVFDVQGFPTEGWGMVEEEDENAVVQAPGEDSVNWTDVQEALRGALRRIAYAAESRPELPPGCTFTLAVELRDGAPAPIGHPQAWIPAQPDLQPATQESPAGQGSSLGGESTTPLRSVQAGPLFFECWVEDGKEISGDVQSS